jgi:hypothetical protein
MELVSVREAARRLGVSDTAVHKARKAGRIVDAGKTPEGWPLLAWPQTQHDWTGNSDSTKRTHVGGTGESPRRIRYSGGEDRKQVLPPRAQVLAEDVAPPEPPAGADAGGAAAVRGPSLAQSKAVREAYLARLAKLDFEERSGKLVDAADARAARFKEITAAKTKIMGIPAACKARVADLPLSVVAMIEDVCRETLEDLANGVS